MVVMLICTGLVFKPVDGANQVTKTYSSVTHSSNGSTSGSNFADIWDLTAGDMEISYSVDLNGIKDEDPGTGGWDWGDHAWSEFGIRDTSTTTNFNPDGKGIWMASDYSDTNGKWPPIKINTFDPDPVGAPTYDMDDKFVLQRISGQAEGNYNLPSTPPSPGNNHRFWFDRDGVDQWQDDSPLAVNGSTYNTEGTYEIKIKLHATSNTTATAYMTVNGLDQGFETNGNWNNIELTPAGMTWTGDMKHLQVFCGLYGYGANHSVIFSNVSVTGYLRYEKLTFELKPPQGEFNNPSWKLNVKPTNSSTVQNYAINDKTKTLDLLPGDYYWEILYSPITTMPQQKISGTITASDTTVSYQLWRIKQGTSVVVKTITGTDITTSCNIRWTMTINNQKYTYDPKYITNILVLPQNILFEYKKTTDTSWKSVTVDLNGSSYPIKLTY